MWQNISPEKLAEITGIPKTRLLDLTEERLGVDVDISKNLAAYFGNSAQYWLQLQEQHDKWRGVV